MWKLFTIIQNYSLHSLEVTVTRQAPDGETTGRAPGSVAHFEADRPYSSVAIFLTWLGGERGTQAGIVLTSFSSFLAVLQPTLAFQVLALAEIHTVRQLSISIYLFCSLLRPIRVAGPFFLKKRKKKAHAREKKKGKRRKHLLRPIL